MEPYPGDAWEPAMKIQEVILRAMALGWRRPSQVCGRGRYTSQRS